MRRLSLAPLVALAACSGASAPPPPVARATASPASDDLRPLSSRDSGGPLVPPPAATPGAAPSLPPGHPPIGGADPHGNVATGGPVKSAGSITGSITIAPKLRSGPSDVLYVMAKRGPSTIAVRRVDKPSFPFAFEISGVDAMVSGIGFEGPVDVVARLSKTGDAIPSKGDLEGTARNVKVPAKGVSITIDSVRQ
jgi:hypothetical protein